MIITPTLPSAPAQTQVTTVNATQPNGFWNDTAKVAGTFTAVAIVIVALIGVIIFLLVRRARSHESMAIRSTSDGDNASVNQAPYGAEKRNSKLTLTTAGLGGIRRGDSNEKSTTEHTPASMSRRASMPLVHDQRLDPRALFQMENANNSHASVASFRDDRDYTRPVLHASHFIGKPVRCFANTYVGAESRLIIFNHTELFNLRTMHPFRQISLGKRLTTHLQQTTTAIDTPFPNRPSSFR